MSTAASSREEAQRRADQIRAFRGDVAALAHEGVDALSPERAALVDAHHDALLASLAHRFDIDRTDAGPPHGARHAPRLGIRRGGTHGGYCVVLLSDLGLALDAGAGDVADDGTDRGARRDGVRGTA